MPAKTALARTRAALIANRVRWGNTEDRVAALAPARRGLLERFERQVDPTGALDPKQRSQLAQEARSAFYREIAKRSHAARRLKAQETAVAA